METQAHCLSPGTTWDSPRSIRLSATLTPRTPAMWTGALLQPSWFCSSQLCLQPTKLQESRRHLGTRLLRKASWSALSGLRSVRNLRIVIMQSFLSAYAWLKNCCSRCTLVRAWWTWDIFQLVWARSLRKQAALSNASTRCCSARWKSELKAEEQLKER